MAPDDMRRGVANSTFRNVLHNRGTETVAYLPHLTYTLYTNAELQYLHSKFALLYISLASSQWRESSNSYNLFRSCSLSSTTFAFPFFSFLFFLQGQDPSGRSFFLIQTFFLRIFFNFGLT